MLATSTSERRRQLLAVVVLLAAVALPLVLFASLDTRPPDDHDTYYTTPLHGDLLTWLEDDEPLPGLRALVRHAVHGGRAQLPPLVRLGWLAALGWLGPSTFAFRIAALPFLLLTVLGSYLAGRQLLGHRGGLLAGFVVGTLPVMLNYSRKVDLMTHGMGLTALALFVALYIVRHPERRTRGVWLALGLIQGLRLYTHPIVLADIALIYLGLLAVLAWEAWGAWGMLWRSRLGGLGLALLATLGVGAWYLLPALEPYEGPSYSLPHYWAARAHFLGLGGEGVDYIPSAVDTVMARIVADLGLIHLHPVVLGLLVLPGLGLLPLALRPVTRDPDEAARRRSLVLLAIVLLAQLPLAMITLRNYAYTVDWVGLCLPTVLLSLASLDLVRRGVVPRATWPSAALGALLVANGVATAAVPMVWSLCGPDPVAHPGRPRGVLLHLFGRCETGSLTTHHFVSRTPHAGVDLAERMAAALEGDPGADLAVVGVWDLRRDLVAAEAAGCDPWTLAAEGCCYWHFTAVEGRQQHKPWPHLFAGFRGLGVLEQPQANRARFHVVRLYHGWTLPRTWWNEDHPAHRSLVDEQCLDEALELVHAKLNAPSSSATVEEDPTQWFTFRDVEQRSSYLGWTIQVDRGGGPVTVPLRSSW